MLNNNINFMSKLKIITPVKIIKLIHLFELFEIARISWRMEQLCILALAEGYQEAFGPYLRALGLSNQSKSVQAH